jgi:hypothetical protein
VGCAHRQANSNALIKNEATISKKEKPEEVIIFEAPRMVGDNFHPQVEKIKIPSQWFISLHLTNGVRIDDVAITEKSYRELTDSQKVFVTYREVYKGRNEPPAIKVIAINW